MDYDILNPGVYRDLALDSDPFKVGTNFCCAAHTAAGRYKDSLNRIKMMNRGIADCDLDYHLRQMEDSCKAILLSGYELFKVYGQIYTLELVV